jgi:hypothetical protein
LVAHYVRDVGVGRSSRLIPTGSVNNENCLPFFVLYLNLTETGLQEEAQPNRKSEKTYYPIYKHQTVLL